MRTLSLLAVLLFSLNVFAQEHKAPATEPAKPAASEPAKPAEGHSTEPAKAEEHGSAPSREHEAAAADHARGPEGEKGGEENVHKQLTESKSVEKFAHMLGMETETASKLFFWINFLIVAGGIFWLGRSGIPQAFRDRTAAIQRGIEEARKASEESSAKLNDIEARLSKLDEEIATMRSEAEANGRAEEQRLAAATEEEKRKIVESAEQEIAAAASNARRELKAFAAELAVGLAEKKIAVNEATDKTLVRDFGQSLTDGRKGGA